MRHQEDGRKVSKKELQEYTAPLACHALGEPLHSKNKKFLQAPPFWCFSLSHVGDLCQYLEGPTVESISTGTPEHFSFEFYGKHVRCGNK